MKKKLVGILMGVAMTATTIAAPTAIFADDIDIADIAVETEADDVADVEVEDEAEPAEEVTAEDDFSAEANDAEGLFTDAEAADFEAQNASAVTSVDVIASVQDGEYNMFTNGPEHITVSSDIAENAGYTDKVTTGVSTLDVLVALHGKNVKDELELWYQEDGGAWIDKMFGTKTTAVSFAVNGLAPDTGEIYKDANGNPTNDYVGKMVNEAAVENGDVVDFFFYKDTQSYSDMYAYFADDNGNFLKSLTVTPGETYTLNVKAYAYATYSLSLKSWRDQFVENVPDGCIEVISSDFSIDANVVGSKITFTVPSNATTQSIYGMEAGTASYRYIMPHIELVVK